MRRAHIASPPRSSSPWPSRLRPRRWIGRPDGAADAAAGHRPRPRRQPPPRRTAGAGGRRAGGRAGRRGGGPAAGVGAGRVHPHESRDEFGIAMPGQPLRVIYPDIPDNFRTRIDFAVADLHLRPDRCACSAPREAESAGLWPGPGRGPQRPEARDHPRLLGGRHSRESVTVLTESLRRMDATLEDVRNRLEVGLIPPNDVLSVEAQRSRQQLLLIQARNLHEQALADLRRLIGAAPGHAALLASAIRHAGSADDGRCRRSSTRRGRAQARPAGDRDAHRRAQATAGRRRWRAGGRSSPWAAASTWPGRTRGSSREPPSGTGRGTRA